MILGLDHTGLAVHDLAAAHALFTRLGFTLTPREALTKPGPDGAPIATGADNHVFMMAHGYQELIAVTDPALGHMIVPRIARYQGLHIAVFATDDADADRAAFAASGIAVSPCMTWGRHVPGRGLAQFKFFMVLDRDAPECMLALVQHLTPALLRTPELLAHANGATAIRGCVLRVADRDEGRARYSRLLGSFDGDERRFPDGTWARLADDASIASAWPGVSGVPPAPSMIAVEFAVARPAVIDACGAPVRRDGAARWLAPADAFGAIVRFVPA